MLPLICNLSSHVILFLQSIKVIPHARILTHLLPISRLVCGPDVDSDDVVTNTRAEGVVVRGRCLLTTLHLRLHRHKCLGSREFLWRNVLTQSSWGVDCRNSPKCLLITNINCPATARGDFRPGSYQTKALQSQERSVKLVQSYL